MKPNIVAFNVVIDTWAKSRESLLGVCQAKALLHRMQHMYEMGDQKMQLNITYNSLLNAWAWSRTQCCAYKTKHYLNQRWELYEAGGNKRVQPDGLSYNMVC